VYTLFFSFFLPFQHLATVYQKSRGQGTSSCLVLTAALERVPRPYAPLYVNARSVGYLCMELVINTLSSNYYSSCSRVHLYFVETSEATSSSSSQLKPVYSGLTLIKQITICRH
jgi:hypothetical protein